MRRLDHEVKNPVTVIRAALAVARTQTGLWLSIVRVIAERHNAAVSLNSVPG
ncbi:hypothetical protein ACFSYH_13685 [Populibacterium corticicola]|uniref:Signal transduction histidine kinase dimerisation/phosphoacceptor domain-containing protein n=1 Tax=Populibacterium corticicola TaxID=1812826 RepID=A0ABW5XHL4_9MICO